MQQHNFIPPATFTEFIERYPRHVRNHIHRKFRLDRADLDDATQDVYTHLLSIPEGSIHANQPDRIATFDGPSDRASEQSFIGYVNTIITRFMLNRLGLHAALVVTKSDSIDDEHNGHLTKALTEEWDSDGGLWFEEVLNIAFEFDPLVAYSGVAVSALNSNEEAAAFLGISVGRLKHCLRVLHKIASGDLSELSVHNRPRRAYRPRKKVGA